jgi:hypothetical protein
VVRVSPTGTAGAAREGFLEESLGWSLNLEVATVLGQVNTRPLWPLWLLYLFLFFQWHWGLNSGLHFARQVLFNWSHTCSPLFFLNVKSFASLFVLENF